MHNAFFSTWQSPVLVKLVPGVPQVCKINIWALQYKLFGKKNVHKVYSKITLLGLYLIFFTQRVMFENFKNQ